MEAEPQIIVTGRKREVLPDASDDAYFERRTSAPDDPILMTQPDDVAPRCNAFCTEECT